MSSPSQDIAHKYIAPLLDPVVKFVGMFYISPVMFYAIIVIPLFVLAYVKAPNNLSRSFFRGVMVFGIIVYTVFAILDEVKFLKTKF